MSEYRIIRKRPRSRINLFYHHKIIKMSQHLTEGYLVQIVDINNDNQLILNENEFKRVLLNNRIKNKKVIRFY